MALGPAWGLAVPGLREAGGDSDTRLSDTPSPVDTEPLGGRPSPHPAHLGHQVPAAKLSPAQSPQTLTLLASEGCPHFRAFAQTLPCDHTSPHLPFPLSPCVWEEPCSGRPCRCHDPESQPGQSSPAPGPHS